jgi:hypothetical protein
MAARKATSIEPRWIPISAWGRDGEYSVSGDRVTARIGHRTASALAPRNRVPSSLLGDADKLLAETLLGEIPY